MFEVFKSYIYIWLLKIDVKKVRLLMIVVKISVFIGIFWWLIFWSVLGVCFLFVMDYNICVEVYKSEVLVDKIEVRIIVFIIEVVVVIFVFLKISVNGLIVMLFIFFFRRDGFV